MYSHNIYVAIVNDFSPIRISFSFLLKQKASIQMVNKIINQYFFASVSSFKYINS